MKKIMIIGHYGGDNAGDELMLYSIIASLLRLYPNSQLYIIAKKKISLYHKFNKLEFFKPNLIKIIPLLFESNMLILGGGTHFHDDYNNKRLIRHYFYMLKILLISFSFKIQKKKVYYLSVGVGPVNKHLTRWIINVANLLSDMIIVRDTRSFKYLQSLKLKQENLFFNFDISVLSIISILNQIEVEKDDKVYGISLTSFEFSDQKIDDSYWYDFFFPIILKYYQNNNCKFKLFAFRSGVRESDIPLCNELYKMLKEFDPVRVELFIFENNIETLLKEIYFCKKFIACRYHSAITAFCAKCELFIIPYHQKLIDFASDISLLDQFILSPINDECNNEKKIYDFFDSKTYFDSQELVNKIYIDTQNILKYFEA